MSFQVARVSNFTLPARLHGRNLLRTAFNGLQISSMIFDPKWGPTVPPSKLFKWVPDSRLVVQPAVYAQRRSPLGHPDLRTYRIWKPSQSSVAWTTLQEADEWWRMMALSQIKEGHPRNCTAMRTKHDNKPRDLDGLGGPKCSNSWDPIWHAAKRKHKSTILCSNCMPTWTAMPAAAVFGNIWQ